jgi:hypothetical protein
MRTFALHQRARVSDGERDERLRDRLGGLDEHHVGDALQGWEFSVEGDTADASPK